jgi:hypothetical protein
MRRARAALAGLSLALIAQITRAGAVLAPDSLPSPAELTCIDVKEPLSFTTPVGLFKVMWTMRLERGPYVSEKADGKGTFYRAPQGGIRLAGNEPATAGHGTAFDGGIYVPNDAREPVKIYFYASRAKAPDEAPSAEAGCATAGYVKDPATSRISVVALGAAGAAGGAAGGIAGRSVAKGGAMSYGQAAGVGAAGGLIAGVFIAWIVNRDAGKIYFPATPKPTPEFLDKLRALAAQKVPLKELQPPPAERGNDSPASTPATGSPAATER